MKLSEDFKLTEINPGVLEWDGNKLIVLGDNRFILCIDESVLSSFEQVKKEIHDFFGESQLCTFVVRRDSVYTSFAEMDGPHFETVFGDFIRDFIWKELENIDLTPRVHAGVPTNYSITKGK